MSAPSLKGDGTPEDVWWAPGGLDTIPARDPAAVRPPGRVVVVAPHPDDEVLGVGGTLAAWAPVEVLVVAVTDGEGSHPDSPTLAPATLADRRADERRAALEVLGIGATVHRLGLPDGGVAADDVAAGLGAVLRHGDTVLVPVDGDGHPDHDATADGGARAAHARRGRVLALPGVALALGRPRHRVVRRRPAAGAARVRPARQGRRDRLLHHPDRPAVGRPPRRDDPLRAGPGALPP